MFNLLAMWIFHLGEGNGLHLYFSRPHIGDAAIVRHGTSSCFLFRGLCLGAYYSKENAGVSGRTPDRPPQLRCRSFGRVCLDWIPRNDLFMQAFRSLPTKKPRDGGALPF